MPTYAFRCPQCGTKTEVVMSISEYVRESPTLICCNHAMERFIDVVPGLALHNALASDRHYEGLRATDGTDISSREKHRAYMKANNLTTADDFKQSWAKAEESRAQTLSGNDQSRASDVINAIAQLER